MSTVVYQFVGASLNTGQVKPRIESLSNIVADAPVSSKMQTMPCLPVPITLSTTSVVLQFSFFFFSYCCNHPWMAISH
jgi:hypothetical protein